MSNKRACIKMNGAVSILFSRQSKSGKKFIGLFCNHTKWVEMSVMLEGWPNINKQARKQTIYYLYMLQINLYQRVFQTIQQAFVSMSFVNHSEFLSNFGDTGWKKLSRDDTPLKQKRQTHPWHLYSPALQCGPAQIFSVQWPITSFLL